jgi:hypothetical protein
VTRAHEIEENGAERSAVECSGVRVPYIERMREGRWCNEEERPVVVGFLIRRFWGEGARWRQFWKMKGGDMLVQFLARRRVAGMVCDDDWPSILGQRH